MHTEISTLSNKINDVRDFLYSLEEENYDLNTIKSRFYEIFSFAKYYRKEYRTHSFCKEGLYRARKHENGEDLFFWTKDFWYRDWVKEPPVNWRYDRCNMPGESVWYFSNRMKACIAEVRPIKDDIITVANIKQFTNKQFDRFLHLGSAFLRQGDIGLDLIYSEEERYKGISDSEVKKIECVDKLFDQIFLMNVPENRKIKYMQSIALVEMFKKSGSGDKTDGIVYPSIALGMDAINVALLNPKLDEFNFYLYKAIQFKVLKAEQDKFYEVEPVWIGKNFQENQYGNFPICWQKPNPEEFKAYSYPIEINPTL